MMYRLISLTGPTKGQRITVEEHPMVFGRDPDCDVCLDDAEVSKRHAVVEHRKEGLVIRDLGSMNRILVNKREVREGHLKHGDMVELGRTRFLVQAVVQAEVNAGSWNWRAAGAKRVGAVVLLVVATAAAAWWGTKPPGKTESTALPSSPKPQATLPETPRAPDVASTQVTEQIRQMRQDLEHITKSVRNIAAKQATTVQPTPMPALEAMPEPATATAAPVEANADPDVAAFHLAQDVMGRGQLDEAETILAGLQERNPDFLPAYVLRANIYEKQGKLEKAIGQWSQVIHRSTETPEYERAYAERARLGEVLRKATKSDSPSVKIASVTQRRFPQTDDYDEMRVFDIALTPTATEGVLEDGSVRVEVWFFDEDLDTRAVSLTRAIAPRDPIVPRGVWAPGEDKSVTASYVVPKGFRFQGPAPDARKQFHGYVVQVYRGNELQDETARPRTLLSPATEALPEKGSSPEVTAATVQKE